MHQTNYYDWNYCLYKMASDNKSDNYISIIKNCKIQLDNLISTALKDAYQQARVTLYHLMVEKLNMRILR